MAPNKIEDLERLRNLRTLVSSAPEEPGVYIHKNEKAEVLYVGKAKNLKNRLKSYFSSIEKHTPKTKALVDKIYSFETIVTTNEYESLLLENNLIKHNKPPYNILLRDDKTYPYLKIDKKAPWPKIVLTRKRKKDGAIYYGPYTTPGQIHQILNVIHRFFPLVKCTSTIFKTVTRPCNYYDIKKCLGPCKLPVDKNVYNKILEQVENILDGHTKETIKKIKLEIEIASEKLEFENAAVLRDQYQALLKLEKNQTITSLDIPLDVDFLCCTFNENLFVFFVTNIRKGKMVGGDSFIIQNPLVSEINCNPLEKILPVFCNFICLYYEKKEIPEFIYAPALKKFFNYPEIKNLNKYLNEKHHSEAEKFLETDSTHFYEKIKKLFHLTNFREYRKHLDDITFMAQKNSENKFSEFIKINEKSNLALDEIKHILNLSSIPLHIECFDISTFQGAQTVASQVVFKDGQPHKSSYRKYIIKETVGHSDDFASLREVMRRRFKTIDNLPDLVIIDGGTPQIREVGWTLKSLGMDHIFIVGLAKSRVKNHFSQSHIESSQERLIIPRRTPSGELIPQEEGSMIILKEGSASFRLLTQIRDEAHRFAITFHRQKRDKQTMMSSNKISTKIK